MGAVRRTTCTRDLSLERTPPAQMDQELVPEASRMSPRASPAAKGTPRGKANPITAEPHGSHTGSDTAESWATSPATRKAMQANRRRDTAPEMAIRRLVHASGLRYRVDARPLPTARHTADMIFARAHVAVFIDGCWWHGCAEHYRPPASNAGYWAAKVTGNRERDQLADEELIKAGWTVIRIWEHESPKLAACRVEAAVRATLGELATTAVAAPRHRRAPLDAPLQDT
jgi:DNA mismatch endonuclease, patch repair protein